MGTILLEGMEFFAFHGCFKEEQIIGTRFIVDLEVDADTRTAEKTDHLKDTLDYVRLYQCVKREMDSKSSLLEYVAGRINEAIKNDFSQIEGIRLKISKLNPPVGGKMAQVCYRTEWKK
jgi:dihydroneopterin aldolase